MICEITNKLVRIMLWGMSYGEEEKRVRVEPDTEVSIKDFVVIVILCPLMLLFITWWYVPCTWIYQNTVWDRTNNILNEKRFKCKKVTK